MTVTLTSARRQRSWTVTVTMFNARELPKSTATIGEMPRTRAKTPILTTKASQMPALKTRKNPKPIANLKQ